MKAIFECCSPCLEIYRNCGKLLKSQNPSVSSSVCEYLNAVEQAGFETAQKLDVSEETRVKLQMPLMSVMEYVKFLGM